MMLKIYLKKQLLTETTLIVSSKTKILMPKTKHFFFVVLAQHHEPESWSSVGRHCQHITMNANSSQRSKTQFYSNIIKIQKSNSSHAPHSPSHFNDSKYTNSWLFNTKGTIGLSTWHILAWQKPTAEASYLHHYTQFIFSYKPSIAAFLKREDLTSWSKTYTSTISVLLCLYNVSDYKQRLELPMTKKRKNF